MLKLLCRYAKFWIAHDSIINDMVTGQWMKALFRITKWVLCGLQQTRRQWRALNWTMVLSIFFDVSVLLDKLVKPNIKCSITLNMNRSTSKSEIDGTIMDFLHIVHLDTTRDVILTNRIYRNSFFAVKRVFSRTFSLFHCYVHTFI